MTNDAISTRTTIWNGPWFSVWTPTRQQVGELLWERIKDQQWEPVRMPSMTPANMTYQEIDFLETIL